MSNEKINTGGGLEGCDVKFVASRLGDEVEVPV